MKFATSALVAAGALRWSCNMAAAQKGSVHISVKAELRVEIEN
jgi:hypothetical protein